MVKSMTSNDKRLHLRIDSLNLLAYSCIDDTGQVVVQGMGRTLNVSQGGILLTPGEDDNYESGIRFHEMDEAAFQILMKYIKAFEEQYGSDP